MFKVGDRVITKETHIIGTVIDTEKMPGKVAIEVDNIREGVPMWSFGNKIGLWLDEDRFERIPQHNKILITSDGATTLARLYDGEKVIKTAQAKCSPDDKFDFLTGAKLAFGRLVGEDKPKAEDKPQTAKHEYKAGDKARVRKDIVTNQFYGGLSLHKGVMSSFRGQIVTIENVTNAGNYIIKENRYIYSPEMLEPYEDKPAPSFDWSAFKTRKFAVHCDTEEKAKRFFAECRQREITWCNHEPLKDDDTHYNLFDHTDEVNYYYQANYPYCGLVSSSKRISGREQYDYPSPFPTQDKPRTYSIGGKEYPLVKREAKVGETVLITEIEKNVTWYCETNRIATDKTYKIIEIGGIDLPIIKTDVGDHTIVHGISYLVLDGYREEKSELLNGKFVCVKAGDYHTVGKVYEFKDGIVNNDTDSLYCSKAMHTLEEANKWFAPFVQFAKLIED